MRKLFLAAMLSLICATSANADLAFVNELHYDNSGTDVGEFAEFAIEQGADLTTVTLELVNGNGGTVYNTTTADQVTAGATGLDFDGTLYDLFVWTPASIQNGAPDGIAITTSIGLQDFISYEGVITNATLGVGTATSVDIGIAEGSGTAVGNSLSLDASGTFVFTEVDTRGAANTIAVPEPSSLTLLGLVGCVGFLRRRR